MRADRMLWLAAGAGAVIAKGLLARARRIDFAGKVVLITGGSRGLGLIISRKLAAQGARLVLAARDERELHDAAAELRKITRHVHTVACDIGEKSECARLVDEAVSRFGPVDVLINDAGIIQVGPLDTMVAEDYEEAMRIHYWGPLNLIMAVLPEMRRRRFGRIVNISSIGGKVSVPHLLPYCASKFALTGLSEGLRAELLKDNVLVTTVCPGLMRTGSHINAWFKGRNRLEYAWFSILNGLPFTGISGDKAAEQIVEATRDGQPELVINLPAQFISKLHGVFPGLTADLMGLMNAVLPRTGGIGREKVKGLASRSLVSPSVLTLLSDRASQRNNEAPGEA